mgnify:CR=1 FL=1
MDKSNEFSQLNFSDFFKSSNDSRLTGTWYNIHWVPDPSSAERINIGVLFVNREKSDHEYRFLNEEQADFFNFVYGETAGFHIKLAINVAKEIIEDSSKRVYLDIERNMPNLKITQGGYVADYTKNDIIDRLFEDITYKKVWDNLIS